MRKIVFVLMLAIFMLFWPSAQAATISESSISPVTDLSTTVSEQTSGEPSAGRLSELNQVRWANHIDAATGKTTMRLVLDVSRPVTASSTVIDGSTPRLVLTIKETLPGKSVKDLTLDGKIVKKVTFDASGQDTKVVIDLPQLLKDTDYKVSTLPSDAEAKRPFRVVVDIQQPSSQKASAVSAVAVGKKNETKSKLRTTEMSQVRWANHKDAVTGITSLRLVMDMSAPVKFSSKVVATPTPRLVLTVKGATPGKAVKNLTFDGKIVEKITFNASEQDTEVVFDLPHLLTDDDYKITTLPRDAKAKRPFRVIVDIKQAEPLPDFSFTPGLKNKLIVLDPGHGGSDPGAIGPSRYNEKTVTLAVAQNVKQLLEKAGAKVVMTREDDRDVYGPGATDVDELKARTTVANNLKADVFVSIHANAFTDRKVGGTSTYYYQKTKYDSMLARALQAGMLEAGGLQDRRANAANFYVIKRTRMPAALVELAFISNPQEEKLLSSPEFQQKMSQGIVRGLEQFFEQAAKLN